MSERVTALARHDFPERPHQNAHLDCQVWTDVYSRVRVRVFSPVVVSSQAGSMKVVYLSFLGLFCGFPSPYMKWNQP